MKHTILPAAKRDIFRQVRYYLDEGADNAASRFLDCVNHSNLSLTTDPLIGALRQLRASSLTGLRSGAVSDSEDIRIYHTVTAGTIRIVRVLHGKRDLSAIFGAKGTQKHS